MLISGLTAGPGSAWQGPAAAAMAAAAAPYLSWLNAATARAEGAAAGAKAAAAVYEAARAATAHPALVAANCNQLLSLGSRICLGRMRQRSQRPRRPMSSCGHRMWRRWWVITVEPRRWLRS
ncbi:Conserved protein of unknown function, PPE family, PPE13 (part4) [Mycobacterium canettii CIPT 140070008]|nr:Conserved protein of unknown function, PPE family, PPE13 (part4) [Mycobacterium canettii CIPT 140070008]